MNKLFDIKTDSRTHKTRPDTSNYQKKLYMAAKYAIGSCGGGGGGYCSHNNDQERSSSECFEKRCWNNKQVVLLC